MSEKFKAPRGTFDVLPEQQPVRRRIGEVAQRRLEAAGYGRMDTPIFEETNLFARGVGESTDIVQKQMFTFEDQGGRSLTLRPEATASICRAYLEHGMQTLAQPVKLWTDGPFFRHERPPASSKVNISFWTMSVASPTPRANSSVSSNAGVAR